MRLGWSLVRSSPLLDVQGESLGDEWLGVVWLGSDVMLVDREWNWIRELDFILVFILSWSEVDF